LTTRINPIIYALIIIAMTITGFPFAPRDSAEVLETKVFQLFPTNEPGVYERSFNIELFRSTVDVEGVDVDASGYFTLQRFVWIELTWLNGRGENKVTLDSFPTKASYEYREDNIELLLQALPYGITVRVKIDGQHEDLPTLTLAYYAPY